MNEQELQWAGDFGTQYAARSPGDVESNGVMFARVIASMDSDPKTVVEFGAGMGSNLRALRKILPQAVLSGVEINEVAFGNMRDIATIAYQMSMLQFAERDAYDLAFTKGVLVHIPPADLARAYEVLYQASRRYILIAEYFAPKLTEIEYRGRRGLLWKGPHAYDMLDRWKDLKLVDYWFVSSRDAFPQDDLNVWLLSKV